MSSTWSVWVSPSSYFCSQQRVITAAGVKSSQSSWTDVTSPFRRALMAACPCRLSAGEAFSSTTDQTSGPLQGTQFKPGSITTKGKSCSAGSSCWNRVAVPSFTTLDVGVSILNQRLVAKLWSQNPPVHHHHHNNNNHYGSVCLWPKNPISVFRAIKINII